MRASLVKTGLLTLVAIGILLGTVIWLRGRGLSSGPTFEVFFKDVDGLREGAPVQLLGIRVGFVDEVEPVVRQGRYFVRVRFSVQSDDVEVPRGSKLTIQQSGLIGEKYVEVTPPLIHDKIVALNRDQAETAIAQLAELQGTEAPWLPVRQLFDSGLMTVGELYSIQRVTEPIQHLKDKPAIINPDDGEYRLIYRISQPGVIEQESPHFQLQWGEHPAHNDDRMMSLALVPKQTDKLTAAPDPDQVFTVEEPLRLKEFFEIQVSSAEALRITNEKISALLSQDTMKKLNQTLTNTETLTRQATSVLNNANQLLVSAQSDLRLLSGAADRLSRDMGELTHNINTVVNDPVLRRNLTDVVQSLSASSRQIQAILESGTLEETLTLVRDTSRNAEALVALTRQSVEQNQLPQKLDKTLANLNTALDRLNVILGEVEDAAEVRGDGSIKQVVEDVRTTADNLRQFSEKLDGHFVLFRLLF